MEIPIYRNLFLPTNVQYIILSGRVQWNNAAAASQSIQQRQKKWSINKAAIEYSPPFLPQSRGEKFKIKINCIVFPFFPSEPQCFHSSAVDPAIFVG